MRSKDPVQALLQPLVAAGMDLTACHLGDNRYRTLLRSVNDKASSLADFQRPGRALSVGSHNALHTLVLRFIRDNRVGPPPPRSLMVEILQPLVDTGVPLTTFSVHSSGYIKRGLNYQDVRARSLADFVHPYRPLPCASYNGMRRLVRKIMRREGLDAAQAMR